MPYSELSSRLEGNNFLLADMPNSLGEITEENIIEPTIDAAAQIYAALLRYMDVDAITRDWLMSSTLTTMHRELEMRYGGAIPPRVIEIIKNAVINLFDEFEKSEKEEAEREQQALESIFA